MNFCQLEPFLATDVRIAGSHLKRYATGVYKHTACTRDAAILSKIDSSRFLVERNGDAYQPLL